MVSVVVQRQGGKEAQWAWEDGKLIVTGADGITDELELRQKAKDAAQTTPRSPVGLGAPAQAQDTV